VNSLPKTVTGQRRGLDLNPGPTAPEASTLTTRLPSHPECKMLLIQNHTACLSIGYTVGVSACLNMHRIAKSASFDCLVIVVPYKPIR